MYDHEIIKRTEEFLRDRLGSGAYLSSHPYDLAYRLEHSYRVANIGRRIAVSEGFDETEMTVACLLHDVSYCEDFGKDGWKDHGRRAAAISRPFLSVLGLPQDRIGDICYGIAIHVDDEADFPGERTPFALTVGDADNIDRFDVLRIHEILLGDGFLEKSLGEKLEYAENRLSKLEKLADMPMATKTAGDIWKERISFQTEFYKRLRAQLLNSGGVII